MSCTINGVTFSDTCTFSSGERWVEGQPAPNTYNYAIGDVTAPGADGIIIKQFGKRDEMWTATLGFCEGSTNTVIAAIDAFLKPLMVQPFAATMAGVTVAAMIGVPNGANVGTPVLMSKAGNAVASCIVTVQLRQLS